MGAKLTWEGHGDGEVLAVDGLHVTVRSSRAFPPGEPANGTLSMPDGARSFTLKVAGSRRDGTTYAVRGRLVNATVDLRSAFARSLGEV